MDRTGEVQKQFFTSAASLAAFKAAGVQPGPMAVLITADEAIASPSARPIIERVARSSERGYLGQCPSGVTLTSPVGALLPPGSGARSEAYHGPLVIQPGSNGPVCG